MTATQTKRVRTETAAHQDEVIYKNVHKIASFEGHGENRNPSYNHTQFCRTILNGTTLQCFLKTSNRILSSATISA